MGAPGGGGARKGSQASSAHTAGRAPAQASAPCRALLTQANASLACRRARPQIRTEAMDRLAENGIAVESWSCASSGRRPGDSGLEDSLLGSSYGSVGTSSAGSSESGSDSAWEEEGGLPRLNGSSNGSSSNGSSRSSLESRCMMRAWAGTHPRAVWPICDVLDVRKGVAGVLRLPLARVYLDAVLVCHAVLCAGPTPHVRRPHSAACAGPQV